MQPANQATPASVKPAIPQSFPPTPGLYPGPGQAVLLRAGTYCYLLQNALITPGQSSIAVQLERTKSGFYYPIGFSLEVAFSGAPGTYEVDAQTSDTDQDSFFVTNTKATTGQNASNVLRLEVTSYWALFARVSFASLQNAVSVSVKITR